jgi:hypothetical protein
LGIKIFLDLVVFSGDIILLTDLYPDNAHFIYELLQNAEDADATEVKFELFQNKLKFYHNGNKFTYEDIDGITSIGRGTKANDINKIGKFGIGFKAVFAYTSTPKIYSEDCNFEISDLVVPTPIESIIPNSSETLMIFPFNNPNKPKEKAYKEIYRGLNNIEDNTLLFLTNIKKISYSIGDKVYNIEREEKDDVVINIINSKNNTRTKWLRFKRKLPIKDKLYVSVAFEVAIDKNTKEEYVKPINDKVFIFFPAEKEKSNLRFHIHAPFASTVARDSIKDLSENGELRDLISNLLLDVLKYVKRNQLLDYNFLACMPNNEDNLSEFYLPIQKSIVEYFNREKFLITDTNTHRSASECFLFDSDSSKDLMKPILKSFIQYFYYKEYKNIYYLAPNKIKNRTKKFIDMLKVFKLTDSDIIFRFIRLTNDNVVLEEIIGSESDKWFKSLYVFLDRNHKYKDEFKKFIRLSNDKLNINQENCYFSNQDITQLPIVKQTVYSRDYEAKRFLKHLGCKEIGEKEEIEIILKENYQNSFVETEKHIEHIHKFIIYYQRHKTDIEFFKKYRFIRVSEYDGYEKPEKIYIDSPFEKTGMSAISKYDKSLFSLNEIYHKLDKEKKKIFIEFLKRLGAITQLTIKEEKLLTIWFHHGKDWIDKKKKRRESKYSKFVDYKFEYDDLFKTNNLDISLLIWNTIKRLDKEKQKAYYQFKKNKDKDDLIDDSTILYQLKNKKWIPDKNGKFYKPQDISKDMLHSEFKYEQNNSWLQAIELGKNIKENEEEYKKKKQIVEEATGLSFELIEQLKDMGEKRVQKWINTQKMKDSLALNQGDGETPEFIQAKNNQTTIVNDKKYKDAIHKENQNNQNKIKTSQTNYKSQDLKEIKKVKDFLYREYEGHCQICGDTFADGDKNTYKIKSLNIGKLRDVNRKGNTLCLCFKHYEICKRNLRNIVFYEKIKHIDKLKIEDINKIFEFYDWVSKEDINTENDAFYMLNEDDEFSRDEVYFFPIRIFGRDEYIKFTKAHLIEFIEVWNEN